MQFTSIATIFFLLVIQRGRIRNAISKNLCGIDYAFNDFLLDCTNDIGGIDQSDPSCNLTFSNFFCEKHCGERENF